MGDEVDMGGSLEELYQGGKVLLPGIGTQFSLGSQAMDAISTAGAFERHPELGLGVNGPQRDFDAAVESLVTVMRAVHDQMDVVGQNLVITAQDFARTDAAIRDAFIAAGGKLT